MEFFARLQCPTAIVIRKALLSVFVVTFAAAISYGQQNPAPFQVAKDSGVFFMQQKQYEQALVYYKQSFEKGNASLYDYYNAACAAALTQQINEAFTLLEKSIELGYLDKSWAMEDADFRSLRTHDRWSSILQKFREQERAIGGKFAAVKEVDAENLIPFRQNGLWGYLDKKSLKVVVKPEFQTLGFMNGCAEVTYRDRCKIRINAVGEVMEIIYPQRNQDFPVGLDDSDSLGPFPVSSANGFKGFRMNGKNEITHFSDIYNRHEPKFFNIDGPFVIRGKYYAVVHKDDGSGVIDEEGNILPGFDFVHEQLAKNHWSTSDDIWFYYIDRDGKSGFVNHKGKRKLTDELLSYPYFGNDRHSYNIQQTDGRYGILDLDKVEWAIKPQALKIVQIESTTKAPCDKYVDDRQDLIEVYFLIEDKGEQYYVDRKMKAYRPRGG